MMNWLKKLMLFKRMILSANLVKKTDYDAKFLAIEKKMPSHDKHITTTEFNKLTTEIFAERSKQANVASKDDIADFVFKKRHILIRNY